MKRLLSVLLSAAILCSFSSGCKEDTGGKETEKPKKYFTLSFDDGTYEDEKLIALLKKYDIPATFCLNAGLMDGENTIEVAGSWKRMLFSYAKENAVYAGFDVISHGFSHREFLSLGDGEIVSETEKDGEKIKELTGKEPVGVAYPGGTAYYDDRVVNALLSGTQIRFARDTDNTYGFSLPGNFMVWKPTCSMLDGRLMSLAEEFAESEATEDMLFYVWDHPWAISAYNGWDNAEKFLSYMAGRSDIVYVTNTEFYELFRDKISSKGLWE